MAASNLRILGKYDDGAYRCLIDIDGEESLYCARHGDDAPMNLWILERVVAWEVDNVIPAWVDLEPAPAPVVEQPTSSGTQTL